MRLLDRAVICVALSSLPLGAQTITTPLSAGDKTITLTTAPAAKGDTIAIYTAPTGAKCDATATAVAPAPNTSNFVLDSAQTAVVLKDPLTEKEIVCAVITSQDKKTVRKAAAVTVGPAPAAPPAPLVNPPQGIALPAVSNVQSSVSVDAVLIPPVIGKRIFGKEIAYHYAVVQLIISNHNQDAALILQSVALDYRNWLFSNNFQPPPGTTAPAEPQTGNTNTYQATNTGNQIASTEARLVRGELEDAQVWTLRNTVIRAAALAGTVASSYAFLGSTNLTTGTSAFGNQVVPALSTFWPDRTPQQINRISDFGFQTNHVIPKASSDIVVAFFPIADFITPQMRKLFIQSPAVFFVPGEMLIDSKLTPTLTSMLQSAGAIPSGSVQDSAKLISGALARYEQVQAGEKIAGGSDAQEAQDNIILEFLRKSSINNINLLVTGIMTVDVSAVPATLTAVTFTTDPTLAATWASGSTVTGTITGSFLTGGTITLGTAVAGISTPITPDVKTSTDKQLNFSFKLTQTIPTATKLDFIVNKQASDKSTTTSAPSEFVVNYTPAAVAPVAAPAVAPAAAPVAH
jgi:hypothetical protein